MTPPRGLQVNPGPEAAVKDEPDDADVAAIKAVGHSTPQVALHMFHDSVSPSHDLVPTHDDPHASPRWLETRLRWFGAPYSAWPGVSQELPEVLAKYKSLRTPKFRYRSVLEQLRKRRSELLPKRSKFRVTWVLLRRVVGGSYGEMVERVAGFQARYNTARTTGLVHVHHGTEVWCPL